MQKHTARHTVRMRSDFNPTRRIARERSAGGDHVTDYRSRYSRFWRGKGDDWALVLSSHFPKVVRGPCDGTKPCSGWASAHSTLLFLVQLVSQTPNGAMHHRASKARSLYVMMHGRKGWKSEGKLCQPRISGETSPGDFWRLGFHQGMLQSAVHGTVCAVSSKVELGG